MERDYWQPSIFWGMSTRCFDTMWIVNIFFGGWWVFTKHVRFHLVPCFDECLPGVGTVWTVSFFFFGGTSWNICFFIWSDIVRKWSPVIVKCSFWVHFFGIFMELVLFPFGPIFWGRLARRYCETSWNFMKHFLLWWWLLVWAFSCGRGEPFCDNLDCKISRERL
jgi:hypothetical protein